MNYEKLYAALKIQAAKELGINPAAIAPLEMLDPIDRGQFCDFMDRLFKQYAPQP